MLLTSLRPRSPRAGLGSAQGGVLGAPPAGRRERAAGSREPGNGNRELGNRSRDTPEPPTLLPLRLVITALLDPGNNLCALPREFLCGKRERCGFCWFSIKSFFPSRFFPPAGQVKVDVVGISYRKLFVAKGTQWLARNCSVASLSLDGPWLSPAKISSTTHELSPRCLGWKHL